MDWVVPLSDLKITEEEKMVKLDTEDARENFESFSKNIEQTEKRFRDHKIILWFMKIWIEISRL